MQVALLCALFAINAAPAREDQFTRLGRARAQFGDKPNSGIWKHVSSDFYGTKILFPVGRSDRRYYITGLLTGGFRLCCESKRGKNITLDWMIYLTMSDQPYVFPRAGTLWKYPGGIFEWEYRAKGFRSKGPIPRAARAALEANDALAGYRLRGPDSDFWFVFPDGTRTWGDGKWRLAEGDYKTLPKTRQPYPITKEERQAILAMKAPRG